MLHVRAPRHMRIGIDMTWISAATSSLIGEDHSLPIEAGRYTITAVNWPGQPSETFPSRDIPRGMRDFRDSCADAADWMRQHCEDPVPVLLDSGDDDVPEVTRDARERLERDHEQRRADRALHRQAAEQHERGQQRRHGQHGERVDARPAATAHRYAGPASAGAGSVTDAPLRAR